MTQTVLFLCPHNAAKSVIAAVYFQQLTKEYPLDWVADSAGTEPSAVISPTVASLLQQEGFDVSHHQPRKVTPEELTAVSLVVSMGCEPDELVGAKKVLMWRDVPATSEDLPGAQAAILAHVEKLVQELH